MLKNIPPILSPELLKVLCEMGEEEGVAVVEIDTDRVKEIRRQLQSLQHQRPELY